MLQYSGKLLQLGWEPVWSKYPHTRYLLPSKQHVQPLEALDLALKHTKLAPILFDQGQGCRCTLPVSLPIPSCSSAKRQATISFCYIRKQVQQFSKHIAKQMLTFWSFWMIPDIAPCIVSNYNPWQYNHCNNAKTRHNNGRNKSQWVQLRLFLFSSDQWTTQKQLMEEASSYQLLKVLGEGRVEITFNSKPNPLMHILRIFF